MGGGKGTLYPKMLERLRKQCDMTITSASVFVCSRACVSVCVRGGVGRAHIDYLFLAPCCEM